MTTQVVFAVEFLLDGNPQMRVQSFRVSNTHHVLTAHDG